MQPAKNYTAPIRDIFDMSVMTLKATAGYVEYEQITHHKSEQHVKSMQEKG